ncbi:MAG: DUF192 domain-containing protein [Planctomycetota bacterium]|jgi:uncharacterized membrane protein (UPF0127 family)|nr:DUF192 domain-containing protein [Planctomycetota bacterium]
MASQKVRVATDQLDRNSRSLLITSAAIAIAISGCTEPSNPVDGGVEEVRIGEMTFNLELALSTERRRQGLGGREMLPADGGMLFAFPRAAQQRFWMYDCLMDIDIAYLDPIGYITAIHTMPKEAPRGVDELEVDYQNRLPGYPSRYPAQFVIELAPGMFETLGLEAGDRIDIPTDRLELLGKQSENDAEDLGSYR